SSGATDHRGGGAIKIEADTLTLNGKILADGGVVTASSHGGGAGGSIWLNVGALTSPSGLGEIRANGSDSRSSVGGGGGGRIAIFYEVLSGIAENKITVAGGAGNKSGNAGTIYKQQTEAPPYVYATSLSALSNQSVQEIRVDFSVPIDATSLTIDDVVVTDAGNVAHYPISITAHSNMSFTFVFAQPFSNGNYKLKVGPNILSILGNGLDQNRNKIAEGEIDAYLFDFIIDVDMPVAVSVNYAVAPAINKISNTQFTISGTRENNTSIWINNAQAVPIGSGDWSHTLTLPQGTSNLAVVAKDAATNASPEVRVIVEVDSIAPSVAPVSPSANTYLAVAPEFIRINVTENGSGIDAVGSTIVVKQNNVMVSGTTTLNAKQFTWTPSASLMDGEYLVSSQVLDLFGNSTAHSYTFVLDREQPAATILNEYPPQTSFNNHTFSGSKEAWSQILINGQVVVGANSSTTWTYNKTLAAGANRLEFVVRDRAGNQSEPVIANIAYDNLPPGKVEPIAVSTGEGSEINITWLAYSEPLNGNDIKNYRVYFNTNPFDNIIGMEPIDILPAGSKSTVVKGLTTGNTYYFAIVAVDKSDLFISQVISVAGQPLDTRAPEEITNLQIVSGLTQLDLRWTPSLDKSGDLESYVINYSDNGEAKTITLSKADVGAANPIVYSITNLQPATAHNLRISVVDKTGNRSTGITNSAITLLPNPINVTAEPGVDSAVVSWTPSNAYSLVKQYAIYIDTNPYTSVAAMTPKKIIAKGSANQSLQSTTLTGLVNGTKVYVAVTVINDSNGELKEVIPVAVTPQNDTENPTITSAEYLSSLAPLSLDTAPVLVQAGKFAIKATDKSKISRVVFTLNGEPLGNVLITNAQGAYEQPLDLLSLADGNYTLGVKVYDMLENVTEKNYPFSIDLIAPAVPTIVAPVQNITINQTSVQVTGKSVVGAEVMIALNGIDLADVIAVDSSGNYSAVIDVVEGSNKIKTKARYIGRTKWSVYSAERNITVNTQIPDAPRGFSATATKQGQVQLQWSAVTSSNTNNQVKGYRVYRSATTFASINDAGVTKLNAQLITATSYTNTVAVDGNYFYAVAAVNEAGNEGALSNVLSVTADSIGPKITQLTFTSEGEFDAANNIFGRGRVIVNATFSEPLRNAPYFAVVPEAGLPISIDLVKSYGDESVYTGQFQIDQSTASGIAYTTMSAFDNVGNRGTDIQQNNSLKIDTQGPDITQLTIAPVEPLKVDAANGLHVNVAIRLSEATKAGTPVKLVPMINGSPLAGVEQGISLVAGAENLSFTGSFDLPNTVAQNASAQLSFAHTAIDELNNSSQKIIGQNQFQVYQGNLPPLNTPADLTATALPGGKIKLKWLAVEKAAAYVLYRQGPADTELIELISLTALEYEDQTLEDGTYRYAIASVRRENGQESESSKSPTVSVTADRVAPAKPENVALELNGAGIVVRWSAPVVDVQGAPQSPQGLTYKLYRTSLPQHAEVTDASVYTPIQTRIPALIALDTKPSDDQHSYFVVAVDAAGNESAPSATDYLNAGLLPVNQLFITLDNNGYPQLSWQHQGRGVEHYRVFRKTGDADAELLTPEGINHSGTNSSYTDNTYNANQASQGAGQEVVYSVIAVDEHDVESKPHELRLPALSVKLERDKSILLERGVMNQLRFRVDNKGTSAAEGVRLYVTLTENGQTREHVSEIFTVAAGANQLVPVVVGGYDKLDAITNLSLRLEQKPQTNQRIRIQQTESVEVGSSGLTLDLSTQNFTRGGAGKVSFNLTNNSDVETELVMATNNSKADSTEVRLILEDLQGNLLARKTIRQTTGGVINVPSGHTVARVAAKSIFNSEEFSLNVPAAAPDQVRLRLVVDKYHYQLGKENHVEISGIGISKDIQLSDTPYFAVVTDVQPTTVNAKNGTVTISGRVVDRTTNEPIANVPVSIVTTVRGFERINTVYSDASGNYIFGYKLDGTAGKYRVSAIHPEMTDRPNHGEFTAEGGSVSPAEIDMKVPRNYPQKINLRVRADQDTHLTNVRLVQIPNAQQPIAELPAGVRVDYSPLTNVAANSYKDLALTFTGDNTAENSGLVTYRVEADNHTGPNALGTVNIIYELSASAPAVKMTP
ncbi:fibronectin type III domain-containing protein, partial [Cellvibrio mixtus]|uniref:fibronectin type III domain-containing protein n=1 Tax=Cellvibrio mixtus TaxID=39650 RepID=UPI0005868824